MITTLLTLALASVVSNASEVAAGGRGLFEGSVQSPVSFAPTAPGHGTKNQLPVTYVAGDAGTQPRGACDLESRRGSGGDVLLSLVAMKDPGEEFGYYDRKMVIPSAYYPLRTGMHYEQNDGVRTTMDYDGTTLTVRDYTTDGPDGPSVTEYQITTDYLLQRVSHVTSATFRGVTPAATAQTAAIDCEPALG